MYSVISISDQVIGDQKLVRGLGILTSERVVSIGIKVPSMTVLVEGIVLTKGSNGILGSDSVGRPIEIAFAVGVVTVNKRLGGVGEALRGLV